MNIIAVDSITPVLSVTAAGPNGKITITVSSGGQHAENMVPIIDRAMSLAGFAPRETNLAVCAEGPGSFTGLRLAYAACKGIQLAASCPLRPVAPLPCYAHNASEWPGAVISVLDAKKNRFYAQVFRRGTPVTDALDVDAKDIMQYVDQAERILVVGPDATLFASALADAVPALDLTALSSGTNGISDIMELFAENENAHYNQEVPDHAGPVYVRKSDAEASQG
jgi:tRNA threonylcarbamoyladenosine biosynthesis protein TsaB